MKDNSIENLAHWMGDLLLECATDMDVDEIRAALEMSLNDLGRYTATRIVNFDEKTHTEEWLICITAAMIPDRDFGNSPTDHWVFVVNGRAVDPNEFFAHLAGRIEQHVDGEVDAKLAELRDYYECGDGW